MAHLVAYAQMSTNKNALSVGNLAKAQCDFCGCKFGSLDEAKRCEEKHIRNLIGNPTKDALEAEFYQGKLKGGASDATL